MQKICTYAPGDREMGDQKGATRRRGEPGTTVPRRHLFERCRGGTILVPLPHHFGAITALRQQLCRRAPIWRIEFQSRSYLAPQIHQFSPSQLCLLQGAMQKHVNSSSGTCNSIQTLVSHADNCLCCDTSVESPDVTVLFTFAVLYNSFQSS